VLLCFYAELVCVCPLSAVSAPAVITGAHVDRLLCRPLSLPTAVGRGKPQAYTPVNNHNSSKPPSPNGSRNANLTGVGDFTPVVADDGSSVAPIEVMVTNLTHEHPSISIFSAGNALSVYLSGWINRWPS